MSELAPTPPESNEDMKLSAEHAAAIVDLEQTAMQTDMSQERYDATLRAINQAHAETPAPIGVAQTIDSELVAAKSDGHEAEQLADASIDARQKLELEARAATENWDEDRLSRAMGTIGTGRPS